MTMPSGSLGHCCVPPLYVVQFLHPVVHSRYSDGGSLCSGSLGSGSLGSGSLGSVLLQGGSLI